MRWAVGVSARLFFHSKEALELAEQSSLLLLLLLLLLLRVIRGAAIRGRGTLIARRRSILGRRYGHDMSSLETFERDHVGRRGRARSSALPANEWWWGEGPAWGWRWRKLWSTGKCTPNCCDSTANSSHSKGKNKLR